MIKMREEGWCLMKMTIEQLAKVCNENNHCVDCPLFHHKHICDDVKWFINLGELEVDVEGMEGTKE